MKAPRAIANLRQRWAEAWEWFWFTPADPTLLGSIRICCGLITLYTTITYCLTLQQFMGPTGWLDIDSRMDDVRNKPVGVNPLIWEDRVYRRAPETDWEKTYAEAYARLWGEYPPGEYPDSEAIMMVKSPTGELLKTSVVEALNNFRMRFGKDLRIFNLPIPKDQQEWDYVVSFTNEFRQPPAPPYPRKADGTWDTAKEESVRAYWQKYGYDPRAAYSRGTPMWSIWFHVTDPTWMMIVQGAIVLVTFLFVICFATRITSALTWFAALSYINRCPVIVFGVDTMMNILLVYLMLSPCGAALSVDRLLARWWSKARPRVVGAWKRWWGKPAENIYAPCRFTCASSTSSPASPSCKGRPGGKAPPCGLRCPTTSSPRCSTRFTTLRCASSAAIASSSRSS
jgi:hypothetical protein